MRENKILHNFLKKIFTRNAFQAKKCCYCMHDSASDGFNVNGDRHWKKHRKCRKGKAQYQACRSIVVQ